MWHKLALISLALSLFSFVSSGYLLWQRYYNPNRLAFSEIPPVRASKLGFQPVRILIPDLKVDLPVIPAQITAGSWPTTSQGVSYLSVSTRPGEVGNSIFYGHNWPRLLGSLRLIKPGALITVRSVTGQTINFVIMKTKIVSPTDISILEPGPERQLTIYTCYGLADTKRFVAIAYMQAPK